MFRKSKLRHGEILKQRKGPKIRSIDCIVLIRDQWHWHVFVEVNLQMIQKFDKMQPQNIRKEKDKNGTLSNYFN